MAMEYRISINEAHLTPITAIEFNPFRREIYTGAEDGSIRIWELDSGKLLYNFNEHSGFVTQLLYCRELKVLFSVSIDGQIIVWGPTNKPMQKISTREPIYCLEYNSRRQQLLCGYKGRVRAFHVYSPEEGHNTEVIERKAISCCEHTDIVSCIITCEGRFYSAGYDRKIVIYDTPHHGKIKLKVIHTVHNAHEAAISCMIYGKNSDNSWIITGSFDRTVKLWSLDGNLLQNFDGFNNTITSVCHVPPTQTLWLSANSPTPIIWDPKGGINVSDFVTTSLPPFIGHIKKLFYVPEGNQIFGTTNNRSIIIWKYNPAASSSTLKGHSDIIETLTFTEKEPLLIFSGGAYSEIQRWERLQLNSFMYSHDTVCFLKDIENIKTSNKEDKRKKLEKPKLKSIRRRYSQIMNTMPSSNYSGSKSLNNLEMMMLPLDIGDMELNKNLVDEPTNKSNKKKQLKIKPSCLKLIYEENFDYLISGYEDSRIIVWGYNDEVLKIPIPEKDKSKNGTLATIPNVSDTGNSDSVTNRVSGLSIKYVFERHKSSISGLVSFCLDNTYWLISSGFDRRICVWNLSTGKFQDVLRIAGQPKDKEELAADDIITDIDYNPNRKEYAYASADRMIYLRKFSPKGDEMPLQAVMQGHEEEVRQIKWNNTYKIWVSGSDDRTIRIWPETGIPCLKVINNIGIVTTLCMDVVNGCIISGANDHIIRIYDPAKGYENVQKHCGHQDEVKSIIHIPTRNQYISASWDGTIRVWNAYIQKSRISLNQPQKNIEGINSFDVNDDYIYGINNDDFSLKKNSSLTLSQNPFNIGFTNGNDEEN
ncbi:WD40 repeat-like protein [Piromyces finnis]|uniref:WD40 repeat-like protein n=1 Tax=Piromyces finnis TaxID=1754191 RepID=A0A1Y1UXG8_9FUNG|nr:WD40 repeat-like protein [Piromyces finnis]|eukprot:ORX42833.1 WD40 repeat-like protein [Piromyces finnis]